MENHFQSKLESIYPSLTRAERLAADYFSGHALQIPRMSLKQICHAAGVSEPTVFRFCRAMGFEGVKDIKLYLASHSLPDTPPQEVSGDGDFVSRILAAEQKILATTIRQLDPSILEQAACTLVRADRIYLYGQGSSFLVCQDAARKLARMQFNAWAVQDTEDLSSYIRHGKETSALMCVSHSGTSRQVIAAMQTARQRGMAVVLMTSYPQSAAARHADVTLQTFAMEDVSLRVGMTSRISQFAVLDALVLTIAHMTEQELFAEMDRNSRKELE